jgi:hypothetical protein
MSDGEVAGAFIGGVDHGPRCIRPVGLADNVPGGFGELVVLPVGIPIVVGHAPGFVGIALQRPQAIALVFFGEMEPHLENQRAVVGQQFFKMADASQFVVELGQLLLSQGLFAQGFRVPGAREHADPAVGGQAAPVPPHQGSVALLVGGGVEREGFDATRIEPFAERVEHIATAGTVNPGHNQHEFERRALELHLQLDELLAQFGELRFVHFLGHPSSLDRRLRHGEEGTRMPEPCRAEPPSI